MATSSSDSARDVESLVGAALDEFAPTQVWVGYSGGVDSTALLLAACRVVSVHHPQIELTGLHIDHGLQAQAGEWAAHCRETCSKLGVPLVVQAVEVAGAGNMEANARAARYAVFEKHVQTDELLLLGHHQQDQTETILYRLFQGRGMAAMRSDGGIGGREEISDCSSSIRARDFAC